MSSVRKLIAGIALVTVASACNEPQGSPVPVNTGDTTPPVIFSLGTQGREGGDLRVTETSGPVSGTMAADESMAVVARADDPEGVRTVEIWGTVEKTCADPQSGLSTRTGPGLVALPLVENIDTATAGGTTTDQRTVRHPVVMTTFTCPQGQRLSLKLVFWAEAANFGGVRAPLSDFLTLMFDAP